MGIDTINVTAARRLALCRAGLLKPEWIGLPGKAAGSGQRARNAALAIVDHFGYLQLDTVSIAGARSHAIVLLSRLAGFDPTLAEALLQPGEPLFEYWGHEASWLPMSLYPLFEFRRQAFRHHPWWGDLLGEHPKVAQDLRRRVREEGAIRSADMEGRGSRGWWDLKIAKRVATALWSAGEFAIRERRHFQRSYDLVERVIPQAHRLQSVSEEDALQALLLKALAGHGWATATTLKQTWRLVRMQAAIKQALQALQEQGLIVPCHLCIAKNKTITGWIRPDDAELAARLSKVRPRKDQGVLLSPFDPVLWDRQRVGQLFGFDQILEIFKPASQRTYGYYCLPVLAGGQLIARFDLKAERKKGELLVLSCRFEDTQRADTKVPSYHHAARVALNRYAEAVKLTPVGWK